MSRIVRCALILALVVLPAAFAGTVRSQLVASSQVEPIETLDGTRVYRLTVDLGSQTSLAGVGVEYRILAADGSTAGGGMFTIRPDMMSSDGSSLSVLTGFGGLELGTGHQVLVKLMELKSSPAGLPTGGERPAGAVESQITDTCTTYCDRCGEQAAALCTRSVQTFSCTCSGDSRSCTFTCASGKPPV